MKLLPVIGQNALGLGIFALVTAGAITLTQSATEDSIEANRKAAAARALYQIIPRESIDNDLLEDRLQLPRAPRLGFQGPLQVHRARRDGEVVAVILPLVTRQGYNGRIRLIVGVHADGRLAGVRVLEHQETPGLGDKIEPQKSDWILDFRGERLRGRPDPGFAVAKDGGRFDQFAGATITPRAVVEAVEDALVFFADHRATLLETQ